MKTNGDIKINCNSVFAPVIKDYIEMKRTTGLKFNQETYYLNRFDQLCNSLELAKVEISKELLNKWEEKSDAENDTTYHHRVRIIRAFSVFMYNNGFEAPHSFHPLPERSRNFIPYIFSESEIQRIFTSLDNLTAVPIAISPVRQYVIPALFRTMYCCGLRLKETLFIKKEDVDLVKHTIRILNSKGNKDRLIVMSQTLADYLTVYMNQEQMKTYESDYFFPAPDHQAYVSSAIYETFRKALFKAGIPHLGRGKGPRVHDLRHSFAVHVLSRWQRQGKDIYVCLPILSTYLGHENLSMTERYLQLVPESYNEVTEPFNQTFKNIFPEVNNEAK